LLRKLEQSLQANAERGLQAKEGCGNVKNKQNHHLEQKKQHAMGGEVGPGKRRGIESARKTTVKERYCRVPRELYHRCCFILRPGQAEAKKRRGKRGGPKPHLGIFVRIQSGKSSARWDQAVGIQHTRAEITSSNREPKRVKADRRGKEEGHHQNPRH